ncbi:MAG TPA: hypothetical protein VF331_28365 [Polyangiales bacterium]
MRSTRKHGQGQRRSDTLPLIGALLGVLCSVSSVHADSSKVAVLALASDRAGDKLCAEFSDALRDQLKASEGYELDDARASLDQLGMAQDCDVTADDCLATIAKRLAVHGFVYGTISVAASGELTVRANLFDTASASVQQTASVTLSKKDASAAEIKDRARSLADELLGRRHAVLRSELLPVEGGAAAASASESRADAAAEAAPHAEPDLGPQEPPRSRGLSARRVAGFALLGTAAVSVGLSALSFVEIDRAQGDQAYDNYRRAVGAMNPKASDVCSEADASKAYGVDARSLGAVRDKCSLGKTYEVLQFVFMGTALASGALSAYFLLSANDSGERATLTGARSLALRPVIERRALGLSARMHF